MAQSSILQERALALTPKFTSIFSMPCSLFLIYEVWCDYKKGTDNAISRILVGMSVIDIMSSSAWFLSSWAVPKGTFAFSAGNRASCNYQGFLLQLAIGAPLYNSSLALFYLLMIKYRWTDDQLAYLEKWVHFFILAFTIGTSVLMLPLGLYNRVGAVCWIIGEPQECGNSSFQPSDVPCDRGNHAWLYGLSTFYGPLWVCVIACSVSMVAIYRHVRKTLRRANRYSFHSRSSSGSSAEDSRRIAAQAILYTISFLFTWMPSTLWSVAHWFNFSTFWLDLASATCEPLQGLWNFSIFLRNRKETQKKVNLILSNVFPCCKHYDPEQLLGHPNRLDNFFLWGRSAATSLRSSVISHYSKDQESSAQFVPSIPVADLRELVDDDLSLSSPAPEAEEAKPHCPSDCSSIDEPTSTAYSDEYVSAAAIEQSARKGSRKRVSFTDMKEEVQGKACEEWIDYDAEATINQNLKSLTDSHRKVDIGGSEGKHAKPDAQSARVVSPDASVAEKEPTEECSEGTSKTSKYVFIAQAPTFVAEEAASAVSYSLRSTVSISMMDEEAEEDESHLPVAPFDDPVVVPRFSSTSFSMLTVEEDSESTMSSSELNRIEI